MGESKGKAWIGKIYNKLEKILVEVDTFTSQSTLCLKSSEPSGWESVRTEPEEEDSNMQRHHNRVASPSSERPFDPPLHQNFELLGDVRVEVDSLDESFSVSSSPDGEMLRTPLVEDYCAANLTSATTRADEVARITNTSTLTPQGGDPLGTQGEKSVEEVRLESYMDDVSLDSQSTQSSVESLGVESECNGHPVLSALGISTNDSNPVATNIPDNAANMRSSNEDNVTDGAPLDTNALRNMPFPEDPSCVDDNALYAVRVRTKKLRSIKRKVLDALNSKRRREEEYEHLAIWFGDANMGSDLASGEDSKQVEDIETKALLVLESEESQWELL